MLEDFQIRIVAPANIYSGRYHMIEELWHESQSVVHKSE